MSIFDCGVVCLYFCWGGNGLFVLLMYGFLVMGDMWNLQCKVFEVGYQFMIWDF